MSAWWKRLGKRIVDEVIWGMYLAAMFICAYVGVYAWFVDRWVYAVLGLGGWAATLGWGLFFKYYVVNPGRGERRKNAVVSGRALWSRVRGHRAVR